MTANNDRQKVGVQNWDLNFTTFCLEMHGKTIAIFLITMHPENKLDKKARAKVTIVTFIKHIKECLKTKRSCMRDKKYTSVHSCAPVSFVVKWNSSGLSAPSIMSEHHQQHITVLSVIQQFACHNYE